MNTSALSDAAKMEAQSSGRLRTIPEAKVVPAQPQVFNHKPLIATIAALIFIAGIGAGYIANDLITNQTADAAMKRAETMLNTLSNRPARREP